MAQFGRSTDWTEDEFIQSTADPNVSVSVIGEELPALTLMTIIGVTIVMLIAIAAIFLLGVLIDWRQQKLIDEKMGAAKRHKIQRRVNPQPEDDGASIANNMEEPGQSVAPAEVLRNIP